MRESKLPSLLALACKQIADNFSSTHPVIAKLTPDLKEKIEPALVEAVKAKCAAQREKKRTYEVTNNRCLDSVCIPIQTQSGPCVLSVHQQGHIAELFPIKKIVEGNIKPTKILNADMSALICASQKTIYALDRARDGNRFLRRYSTTFDTRATKHTHRFVYEGKSNIKHACILDSTQTIIPRGENGIYALTLYTDWTNTYRNQQLYSVDLDGNCHYCTSRTSESPLIQTVIDLWEDRKAIVYENGALELVNSQFKSLYEFPRVGIDAQSQVSSNSSVSKDKKR